MGMIKQLAPAASTTDSAVGECIDSAPQTNMGMSTGLMAAASLDDISMCQCLISAVGYNENKALQNIMGASDELAMITSSEALVHHCPPADLAVGENSDMAPPQHNLL